VTAFLFVLAFFSMGVSLWAGFKSADVRYPEKGIGRQRRARQIAGLSIVVSLATAWLCYWGVFLSHNLGVELAVGGFGFAWFWAICEGVGSYYGSRSEEYNERLGKTLSC
jgi:hypothetical protein